MAAPITALNYQDFAIWRSTSHAVATLNQMFWSLGLRVATIAVALAALVTAWPGWLQGGQLDGRYVRRVSWRIEADPALKALAAQLQEWQGQGLIPADAHVLNYIPDIAYYLAWYLPEGKLHEGFYDNRFRLYPARVALDYLELRRFLQKGPVADKPTIDWAEVLRKYNIQYVILNRNDSTSLEAFFQLLHNSFEWQLVFMQGGTSVFRWIDPHKSPVPPGPQQFDSNRAAFGTKTVGAPATGPSQAPQPLSFWDDYLTGSAPAPEAALTAGQYGMYFEFMRDLWPIPYVVANQEFTAASLTCSLATVPFMPTTLAQFEFIASSLLKGMVAPGRITPSPFIQDTDRGPPGSPILAIRYARVGIEQNPEDPASYRALASAYNLIWRSQEDPWSRNSLRSNQFSFRQLRHVQWITALRNTLQFSPRDAKTHMNMFEAFRQLNMNDLALEHMTRWAEAVREEGPRGVDPRRFNMDLTELERQVTEFKAGLDERRRVFDEKTAQMPSIQKALIAINAGLAGYGLELFNQADHTTFRPDHLVVLVHLLLQQGRIDEANGLLRDEFRQSLGLQYDWCKTLVYAARGDYDLAIKSLDSLVTNSEFAATAKALEASQWQMFHGATVEALVGPPQVALLLRQQADLRALKALVALEKGDIDQARRGFQEVLALGDPKIFLFDNKAIAQHYLKLIESANATASK